MKQNCCQRCKWYDAFYIENEKGFERAKIGVCSHSDKIVVQCDCCECFIANGKLKRNIMILQECLNDLLTELSKSHEISDKENVETDDG